ncbi:SLC13 family permease [Janthinobacterium sp.]|uniref:SLC13 family permease n=1 Tax=Janthinobacterium sp. TaxID=1871054 RepID=UPI00293D2A29|nr:SLC13 family permease [Janthinobacterium sp.]
MNESNALPRATRAAPPRGLKGIAAHLLKDTLLLILLAALLLLTALAPGAVAGYPALVDWPTMAALTGLLVLTKGLEASGSLHHLGAWLIGFMATERATALCLVLAAALLSTLLTNDVALFVVVPLTLGVCRITGMSATKLIVFEALAVNAGSALTPIGNPQNLFLWQLSGAPFSAFVLHMLPLVAVLMLLLLALTACVFPGRPVAALAEAAPAPLDRTLFGVSLALYLPFLLATDAHQAPWAVAAVLLIFVCLRPGVLRQVDWALLLVFVLMFIDLRLFASLDGVHRMMAGLDLSQPAQLYLSAIAASQVVSNVPAAIALSEFSRNWQVLAYGVNVGGFGLMVGSLANLIALRMAGERRAYLIFHLYALPFLLVAAGVGYVLMF